MKFKQTGHSLRKIRILLGKTQSQLAKDIGLHSQFISNAERGLCVYPNYNMRKLIALMSGQGIAPSELLESFKRDYIDLSREKSIKWLGR